MKAALGLLIALSSVANAGNRVVVMAGDDNSAALSVSLASRNVEVAPDAAPEGALQLDRAAAVQHAAQTGGATAGIWIDANEVWVVSADGAYLRHTPLPAGASPRVFAAIATSLLDELFAPAVNVDVYVNGSPATVAQPNQPVARPVVIANAPPPQPVLDVSHRTLLEVGLTLSPASYGVEAELAFPVTPNFRVGVLGGANQLFDGYGDVLSGTQMFDAAGELRYIGRGTGSHMEYGFLGGIMRGTTDSMDKDTNGFAALRIGYVKQYDSSSVMFSLAPMVLFDERGHDNTFAIMSSLRLEMPI